MIDEQEHQELLEAYRETEAELLAQSKVNAAVFIEHYFDITLDDWQVAVCHELSKGRNVAVTACNGAGKTLLAAGAVNWFLETKPNSIVVTTASTGRQVKAQLWGEIRELRARSRYPLRGETTTMSITVSPKWYAIGFSTDDPGFFEGFHAEHVLIVIDEGKSVPREIWDAIERLRAVGKTVLMLAISTPGSKLTGFYDCFTKDRRRYSCFRIPAVPVEGVPWVAKRIKQDWLADMALKFPPDHPLYKSMVLAEFFDESIHACVPFAWVEAAIGRDLQVTPEAPATMGVDVARSEGGDETSIRVLKGGRVIYSEDFRVRDTVYIRGRVIAVMQKFGVLPQSCAIDDGGVGGGVVDELRNEGYNVTPVQFGAPALESHIFADRGSELWWKMRQRFEVDASGHGGRISIENDTLLISQLTTRNFTTDGKGRTRLESKDSLTQRNLPSPDRADALALACAGAENSFEVGAWSAASETQPVGGGVAKKEAELEKINKIKERFKKLQAESDAKRQG